MALQEAQGLTARFNPQASVLPLGSGAKQASDT
jgi:hypothetical protein